MVGVLGDPIQLKCVPARLSSALDPGILRGTPIDSEGALAVCVPDNIRPMIETASLEQAADAFVRMTQEEMHEYGIETKERRNYRDPSNL